MREVASRIFSLVVLLSWPWKLGLHDSVRTYLRLMRLSRSGFDKVYYQREVFDLQSLHPIVHFLDRGEASGYLPIPPVPVERAATASFKEGCRSEADRLFSAFNFRPPEFFSGPKVTGRQVDIVMPCFNRRQTVGRAIRSVLGQTYSERRLIVCDDGSVDGTADYIYAEFAEEIRDGSLFLIRSEHVGVSTARNIALECVRSDWVAYLDSDNHWTPDHLALHMEALKGGENGWSYGGLLEKNGTGPVRTRLYDRFALLQENWIDLNTVVHRADWLAIVGGFDIRLRRLVDYDLVLRLGRLGPPAVIDTPTVNYSSSKDSITSRENFEKARVRVRLSHIFERVSWGLVKPRLFLDADSLKGIIDPMTQLGLVDIVLHRRDADFQVCTVEKFAPGPPVIRILDDFSINSNALESNIAVNLINSVPAAEISAFELAQLAQCQRLTVD